MHRIIAGMSFKASFKKALFSLPVLALSAGMAQAVPLNGSYTLTKTGTANVVVVTPDLANPFALTLTYGIPDIEDFLTITPHTNGTADHIFTINANFTFTLPGTGTFADLGSGTLNVHGHDVTGGTLTWADGPTGTDILLSNGDTLNLNLSDVTFTGDSRPPAGNHAPTPQTVTATFTLTQGGGGGGNSVPEPSTTALLGAGLLGFAFFGRHRRRANQRG